MKDHSLALVRLRLTALWLITSLSMTAFGNESLAQAPSPSQASSQTPAQALRDAKSIAQPVPDPLPNLASDSNHRQMFGDAELTDAAIQGFIYGQNKNGETNALVKDARVTVTSIDGKQTKTSQADETGFYVVEGLDPGQYRVKVVADGYQTEDAQRGFRLQTPSFHTMDFFLANGNDPPLNSGELTVKIVAEDADRKSPLSGVVVKALKLNGRQSLTIAETAVGVYQTKLPTGDWSISVVIPGYSGKLRQAISITRSEAAVCEFLLQPESETLAATASAMAVIAVEKSQTVIDEKLVIKFGQPTSGTVSAKRSAPSSLDWLEEPVDASKPRKLTGKELADLGRRPDQMPPGDWVWYLASPSAPLMPGIYQVVAHLDGYRSERSNAKQVRSDETTIFDMILRKQTGASERQSFPQQTVLQGHVYGQDELGQTIELVAGAEVVLRDSAGSLVKSTRADQSGFYSFSEMPWADFSYRVSGRGYRLENAGRGLTVSGPGTHVLDLFLAKDRSVFHDVEDRSGHLEGYVTEVTSEGKRSLSHAEDDASVKAISVRDGKTVYLNPDDNGHYQADLDSGIWLINSTAKGYGSLPKPAKVELIDGTIQRRDFTFSKELPKGKLIGGFWEETSDGDRVRLAQDGASVQVSNVRTGETLNLPTHDAIYQSTLATGDWRAVPTVPSGFKVVAPHGASIARVVSASTCRLDFVVKRLQRGKWICRVWRDGEDGKVPARARVMLRQRGPESSDVSESVLVINQHQMSLKPGKWIASVVPPSGFNLAEPDAPVNFKITADDAVTTDFLISKNPCATGSAYALVAIENGTRRSAELPTQSLPEVTFLRTASANASEEIFAGSGSRGAGVSANKIRLLTRRDYSKWGISPAQANQWIWYLAETDEPLPADRYIAEASLSGYRTDKTVSRTVSCGLSTVFDLKLLRRRPQILVVVTDKDDQPLSDTNIKLVGEGKALRDAITMTTDQSGQADRKLEQGTGVYKVLVAPKGYEAFGRRVSILEDENVLKFRLFKTGQQPIEDVRGTVLGETIDHRNDSFAQAETLPVGQASIMLQPIGEDGLSQDFQKPYFSKADGEFEIRKLPTGTYHLTVSKKEYQTLFTQVEVSPAMQPVTLVLTRRNDEFDNAIACMLRKGWGKTSAAQAAAKRFYQLARQAQPSHPAADYALTLCLLSARKDKVARMQVARALSMQSDDFVWDRAIEARLWLDMFLDEPRSAIQTILSLSKKQYDQRIGNPASVDTARLLGVIVGFLETMEQDLVSLPKFSEKEAVLLKSLNDWQVARFQEGRRHAVETQDLFASELASIAKECRRIKEEELASKALEMERRIEQTKLQIAKDEIRLDSLSLQDIDTQIEDLYESKQSLQLEYEKKELVYSEIEREYFASQREWNRCRSTTTNSYQEIYINGGNGGGGIRGGGGSAQGGGGMFRLPSTKPRKTNVTELSSRPLGLIFAPNFGSLLFGQSSYGQSGYSPNTGQGYEYEYSDPPKRRRVRVKTTISNQCNELRQQVLTLSSRLKKIQVEGNQIEVNIRKHQKQIQRLESERSRIINFKKQLKRQVSLSRLQVSQASTTSGFSDSNLQEAACKEVLEKEAQMTEFHRFLSYPLEKRRQELLQWVSLEQSESCQ